MNLADLQNTTFVKQLNSMDRELAAMHLYHNLQMGMDGIAWDIMRELGFKEIRPVHIYLAVDKLREQSVREIFEPVFEPVPEWLREMWT